MPPEVEGYSAFPIFHKYPKSFKKFNDMTGGIDPLAVAEIKRLQPYNRGDWFFRDRLWQLNQLEVIDKHRLPHTTTLSNLSALSFFEPDGIDIEEIDTLFTFFDESAPIAQYPAFDSTGAEVNVNFTAAFDVCFSESVPGGLLGSSISSTLMSIHLHIVNKVLPVLTPYLIRH